MKPLCMDCKTTRSANDCYAFLCTPCHDIRRAKELDQMQSRFNTLAEETTNLSKKCASGRHTGADVQRLNRLTETLVELDEELTRRRRK